MRNRLREFLIATSQQGCSENRNGGNMPSTYAHYRMGQEVYRNLTGKPKQIIEKYKELYDIGLHGPDILFYYKPLFANPVNQVGYAMHDRPGIEFFRQASLVMQKAENKEACEAYIYGFCCHFALDVSCHGYIDEKIAESSVCSGWFPQFTCLNRQVYVSSAARESVRTSRIFFPSYSVISIFAA